jgi:Protein of unknown function (DUF1488)
MPLIHLNEEFNATLEGINFGMRDGDRAVRCLVTDEAMADAMGGSPTRAQESEWFRTNRGQVEKIASAKYGHGMLEPDGSVCVVTQDLNPNLLR